MRLFRYIVIGLALLPAAATAGVSGSIGDLLPDSVLSITPLTEHSYIAVRIPVCDGVAVAGARWYNNDSESVFPQLLVASGADPFPPDIAGAVQVAVAVAGPSGGYGEVTFASPATSLTDALYIIFQLPQNAPRVGVGTGGGAGLGYKRMGGGPGAYLSADGQDWVRLSEQCRLLVEPILIARESGMLALSVGGQQDAGEAGQRGATEQVGNSFVAAPNPFNGGTTISYTLGEEARVRLVVYDLRGATVRRLKDGWLAAGRYVAVWDGRTDFGRSLASGRYIAKLKVGQQEWSMNLTLVR